MLQIEISLDFCTQYAQSSLLPQDVRESKNRVVEVDQLYPQLVRSEMIGAWNVFCCSICGVYTHSINYIEGFTAFTETVKVCL